MSVFTDAITSLRPGAAYLSDSNNYTKLQWLDSVQIKPTEAEVNAEITRLDGVAAAEAARASTIKEDAGRVDLLSRLKTATPAQINTWVDANVTTIATARTVLKAIIKVIALDART